MTGNILEKLFKHNNWANRQIIQACYALGDEQLDAEPQSATRGSIRRTLLQLVSSQQGYLSHLTLPAEERRRTPPRNPPSCRGRQALAEEVTDALRKSDDADR